MLSLKPVELNYNSYSRTRYDDEIALSIPGYAELHAELAAELARAFPQKTIDVLELGIGTGLTTEVVLRHVSCRRYDALDFSATMLRGAQERLSGTVVNLVQGDYAHVPFTQNNDLVVSVIGIHHQATDSAKQKLFYRIFTSLAPGGVFLFGDLMTYKDNKKAALKDAQHYHHLVQNFNDESSLAQWAHHHKFMNRLAPLESQLVWLYEAGFVDTRVLFEKFNTVLVRASR